MYDVCIALLWELPKRYIPDNANKPCWKAQRKSCMQRGVVLELKKIKVAQIETNSAAVFL